MVTLVTGKVDSGKTTYLLAQYREHRQGDGFLSLKKTSGAKVAGYSSLRLSTMEETRWMIHSDFYQGEFAHDGRIGPYHMDLDQLSEIEDALQTMIRQHVSPIYLDEIGRLELSGQGYDRMLKLLFLSNLDIIIAVREDLAQPVIERYRLTQCQIVRANP